MKAAKGTEGVVLSLPQSAPQQPAPESPARRMPLWLPITGGVCLLLALALLITRKYWWK